MKTQKKQIVSKTKQVESHLENLFLKTWNDVVSNHFPDQGTRLKLESQVLVRKLVPIAADAPPLDHTVDFYCPGLAASFEINGATHQGRNGAHSSYYGLNRDYHKQRILTLGGIKHFEFDSPMVKDAEIYRQTIQALIYPPTPLHPLPSPSLLLSWGRNKSKATKEKRYRKALEKWVQQGHSRCPTTTQLSEITGVPKTKIKPIMLALGWRQKSYQNSLVWIIPDV